MRSEGGAANPAREGAHLHNAKYSFVAGLAHGLGKSVLMLAQGDALAPLDYRDLLKQYQTGSEAERHLHSWIVPIMERLKTKTSAQQLYLNAVKLAQQLSELKIGEPIAENEADKNGILAQRLTRSRPGPPRFKINFAFWAFLEIQPNGLKIFS